MVTRTRTIIVCLAISFLVIGLVAILYPGIPEQETILIVEQNDSLEKLQTILELCNMDNYEGPTLRWDNSTHNINTNTCIWGEKTSGVTIDRTYYSTPVN